MAGIKIFKKAGTALNGSADLRMRDVAVGAKELRSGHLSGVHFDVFPSEPTNEAMCLINCPTTILTDEAQSNTGRARSRPTRSSALNDSFCSALQNNNTHAQEQTRLHLAEAGALVPNSLVLGVEEKRRRR